jgi:hypothetical protein
MPLRSEVAKSLNYLRQRYKVSERDLMSLAKKLNKHDEEPEVSWEELTVRYLRDRRGRFTRQNRKRYR